MGGKATDKGPGSGRPKNPPKPKKMLKEVIPVKDIFTEEELEVYNSLVDAYMDDFDEEELTSSDVDDLLSLCMNKIFEIRLLKGSKDDPDIHMDVASTLEKMRRQTEKFKENLASRRRDRIDPNRYKGFSIVDLAVAFDQEKKMKIENKVRSLKEGEAEVRERLDEHRGNRYDADGDMNKDNA